MGLGGRYAAPSALQRGRTDAKLGKRMRPLLLKLPGAYEQGQALAHRSDLRLIERVAAPRSFGVERGKIGIDGGQRRRLRSESRKLRMAAVAAGLPAQHGLREERLTPQGDEALRVEILRVQRPQSHALLGDASK
jgi:hypothetical protein